MTALFLGFSLGCLVDPAVGQQPQSVSTKSEVCSSRVDRALISKVLLDDGNRILNPKGNFLIVYTGIPF